MMPGDFLNILSRAAMLKTTTRHCFTEENRKESVADHSWRIALMAMLLSKEPEFQDTDMNKVSTAGSFRSIIIRGTIVSSHRMCRTFR